MFWKIVNYTLLLLNIHAIVVCLRYFEFIEMYVPLLVRGETVDMMFPVFQIPIILLLSGIAFAYQAINGIRGKKIVIPLINLFLPIFLIFVYIVLMFTS